MKFAIKKRSDHDSWMVRWFEHGTKRRKNFKTHGAAVDWVRDQRLLSATGASPIEVAAATRVAAGTGWDLETLVKVGLEQMRASGATRADASLTFQEASQQVIERAVKRGARPITVAGYRRTFAAMNRDLGTRVVAALSQNDVEAYLNNLPDRAGIAGQASLATKASRLGHIRMCMGVAGIAESLPNLALPEDESDVEFFSIQEIKLILSATPEAARGFVAVALFACIRPENLEKLPEDVVSLEAKRIRIPKGIAKDRHGHLLEANLLPPVLWKWLERYPYKQMRWAPLQRRLKRAAGRWIHDGIRHTGATYYCALHGVGQTARLLTHESEKLVRSHYAGMIDSISVAKEFEKLTPAKITFREAPATVIWPDDAMLAHLLKSKPAVEIAAQLGCSDSALTKHCRTRNIAKPRRGYWTKQAWAVSSPA